MAVKAKDGDFFVTDWLRNRNTLEYLGLWEMLNNPNFNPIEFEGFRNQAGLNAIQQMTVLENAEQRNVLKA